MNIMPDGTGWILPPRCAARYTMGVLWRYGVQILTYHDVDPTAEVARIVMNIRNPYTRLRSWLRLWNTTLEKPIDAINYFENLHSGKYGVCYMNKIEEWKIGDPWVYLFPLYSYTDFLQKHSKSVDHFIRQEHLESDMEQIGYPVRGYEYPINVPSDEEIQQKINEGFRVKDKNEKWEPGDGLTDREFYFDNPFCADIVATYYSKDFETFGYSKNICDIYA